MNTLTAWLYSPIYKLIKKLRSKCSATKTIRWKIAAASNETCLCYKLWHSHSVNWWIANANKFVGGRQSVWQHSSRLQTRNAIRAQNKRTCKYHRGPRHLNEFCIIYKIPSGSNNRIPMRFKAAHTHIQTCINKKSTNALLFHILMQTCALLLSSQ